MSGHSPIEIASLHLVLALAQPGHEGVGEPALLVTVRLQPIHRNGILGKMGHLAEQACRHPPVLPRVALHCLLGGQDPSACIPHCMTQLDGQIARGEESMCESLEVLCSAALPALGSGPLCMHTPQHDSS